MKRLQRMAAAVVLLSATILAACSGVAPTPEPTRVTVQLNWLHSVEFAGYYVAEQKGYYAEEGLAVTLLPGGKGIDPTIEVLDGRADFGQASGMALIVRRAQQEPLVAIAAPFRKTPRAVMALAGSGVAGPKDLARKKIGLYSAYLDSVSVLQLLAMLRQMDVDRGRITFTPIEDYGVGSLSSGAMDAVYCQVTDGVVAARLEGHEMNIILLEDYGVHDYPNAMFTTERMINEKPEVVGRFVRATLKGYQYAIENPGEAVQITLRYNGDLNEKQQIASMHAQTPLIDTGDAPVGQMDGRVWKSAQDVLLEQGFLEARVDVDEAYTNKFVELSFAVAQGTPAPLPTPVSAASVEFTISGSGSVTPILEAVKPAFEVDTPGYSLKILPGFDTGKGVSGVIEGLLDVAAMARPPKDEEAAQGMEYVEFGQSGVAVYAQPKVGVTDLAAGQIAAIFSGKVTNWSEVGGPDAAIVLYVRDEGDSSTKALREAVFGDTPFPATAQVLTSQADMQAAVGRTPYSVGFGSWPSALAVGAKVQPIALDGAAPGDPAYPIVSPMGIGYLAAREAEVKPLIDWLLSERGRVALQKFDVITVR
jgi:NitT/TauT family transport system substrate-binding protein